MGNVLGGQLTGQLAGGVGAHAVGYQEQVPSASPLAVVHRQLHGQRVLI
jgi:hypothetical protein